MNNSIGIDRQTTEREERRGVVKAGCRAQVIKADESDEYLAHLEHLEHLESPDNSHWWGEKKR